MLFPLKNPETIQKPKESNENRLYLSKGVKNKVQLPPLKVIGGSKQPFRNASKRIKNNQKVERHLDYFEVY